MYRQVAPVIASVAYVEQGSRWRTRQARRPVLLDPHVRIKAASRFFVPPERMKLLGPALGAQVRRVDPLRRYARVDELPPVGFREVDVRPSVLTKLRRDLRPDLVTALTDAGSDRCVEIGRRRSETLGHRLHGAFDDVGHRTPPTGVDRRHSPLAFVNQQDRDAIRRLDRNHRAYGVFEQRIALAQNSVPARGRYTGGRMNLFEGGKLGESLRDIGQASSETMHQPSQRIKFPNAVDVLRILIEHGYAGF